MTKTGDIVSFVVGVPGPDIDYGVVVGFEGDRTIVRSKSWNRPEQPWRDNPWSQVWLADMSKAGFLGQYRDELLALRGEVRRNHTKRFEGTI